MLAGFTADFDECVVRGRVFASDETKNGASTALKLERLVYYKHAKDKLTPKVDRQATQRPGPP